MNIYLNESKSCATSTSSPGKRSGDTDSLRLRELRNGMTYALANKVLDKVKEGVNYPLEIVNKALEITGDKDD